MTRSIGYLKIGALGAALALGSMTLSEPALAFHGGGGGGFHGGGGFGGGGFHGGFAGGGFRGGGWSGRGYYGGGYGGWGYPGYAWGWGYPGYGYGYYDGYPACGIGQVRVRTVYGWAWRSVSYC